MLKYSERVALGLFLSEYVAFQGEEERTFREICNDVEAEDNEMVTVWDGISCVRGYDISTLIHEVEEAIADTIIRERTSANLRTQAGSGDNS